ncbi:MAG: hypothetical protein LQ350_005784 [Teloschistes chrysophthalmus]|nr:MAG: hypothetical protein LQ350_005784 [Niorma chrysophthalma]
MSELTGAIDDEIEAINSIYGESTLYEYSDGAAFNGHVLTIPSREVVLRLIIPKQYPDVCIDIIAVEGVGSTVPKGYGNHVLITARDVLSKVFIPGQVCLFDLLQELEQRLDQEASAQEEGRLENEDPKARVHHETETPREVDVPNEVSFIPEWTLSTTITEKKSSFLARACAIKSTTEVEAAITHLLTSDKRAGKATHNISAYRIRTVINGNEVVYQDCDDDGEDAAGGRLLKLLQMMDVLNVLVVVSRWYGGVKLGPARFGIINAVARQAVIAGGFAKD